MVRDSIIMQDSVIEADAVVDKAIVAEDVRIALAPVWALENTHPVNTIQKYTSSTW